jgi:LacI family transcriptional regulator
MNKNILWEGFNNYKAGREMMNFIIRYGHRKIGMIHGPLRDISAGADRYRAYKDTLKELKISINSDWVIESNFTLTGGYKAMEKIILSKKIPAAVYCANDTIAIGAMNCALDFGYDVPEDISITGFDDIEMASAVKP